VVWSTAYGSEKVREKSVRNIKLTSKNEIDKRNINAKKKTNARFPLQLETITGKSSELSGSVLNPMIYFA
jgi:hypothetical protein